MTKVRIDTPGTTIEIESDEPLSVVSRKALKLFERAGGWPQDGHGPAAGFSAMERRWTPESNGSAMRVPPAPVGFAAPQEAS